MNNNECNLKNTTDGLKLTSQKIKQNRKIGYNSTHYQYVEYSTSTHINF